MNKIRNKLTHHEPKWVKGGSKTYTENEYGIEENLKGEFELNPFTSDGNAFFPTQCLSYGCAEWGLSHANSLVKKFKKKIGVKK